jgi:hypothetical protein
VDLRIEDRKILNLNLKNEVLIYFTMARFCEHGVELSVSRIIREF